MGIGDIFRFFVPIRELALMMKNGQISAHFYKTKVGFYDFLRLFIFFLSRKMVKNGKKPTFCGQTPTFKNKSGHEKWLIRAVCEAKAHLPTFIPIKFVENKIKYIKKLRKKVGIWPRAYFCLKISVFLTKFGRVLAREKNMLFYEENRYVKLIFDDILFSFGENLGIGDGM